MRTQGHHPVISVIIALTIAGTPSMGAWAQEAHAPVSGLTDARLAFSRTPRFDFDPPDVGSYTLPVIGEAADGRLLNADGRSTSLHAAMEDTVVILSFIYTRCSSPTGCPMATSVLGRIFRASAADAELADHLRLLTVSFDPANDTPEVIAHYRDIVANTEGGVSWEFLTAEDEAALDPILSAYGQTVSREQSTGAITHLLRVYLIDRARQVRNVYGYDFLDPRLLITDIKTLLQEERAQRALKPIEHPPLGLPPLTLPAENLPTVDKIILGRKLFFDRRLSQNGTMSCAMCHLPEQGFTNNELARPIGVEGRSVRRNSPTIFNVAYATSFFHDGRASSLEAQAVGPFTARAEMGNASMDVVVAKAASLSDYDGMFTRAFDGPPTADRIGQAIASYERSVLSANAPFDQWRYGERPDALSSEAQRGFELFVGRAGCSACHRVNGAFALFTDQAFHDTGVARETERRLTDSDPIRVEIAPGLRVPMLRAELAAISGPVSSDVGRHEVTGDPADRWRFRTPILRNVALTAPYMHDGAFPTLRAVINHYNRGGDPHPNQDPRIRPLGLGARDVDALVAFLNSLTGSNVDDLLTEARGGVTIP